MKILKFLFILFFIFNINNAALAKSNDKLELKILPVILTDFDGNF